MTREGVVGRNYAYQIGGGATVFFDEKTWMNPFMGAGALSMVIDDFNTGNFDHGKEGSHRRRRHHPTPSATGRPRSASDRCRPARRRWGTEWKRAVVRHRQPYAGHQQSGQRDGLSPELSRSGPDLPRSLTVARSCA